MRNINIFSRLIGMAMAVSITAGVLANNEIGPGSPAPELTIKKWLKGDKVEKLQKDKTYVVEFWATWCGPCIQAMPHVTELAEANKDVIFLGVGIWEDDVDGVLEAFVEKMGDKIGYNLGYSGNKDGMSVSWMEAAAQNGIPSAFIVQNGVIQWIGHPMSLDKPLAEVKAGTFDLAAFKVKFDKQAETARLRMALNKRMTELQTMFKSGNRSEAKKGLDDLLAENPNSAAEVESIRFGWLAVEDPSAWKSKAEEKSKVGPRERLDLCNFAIRQTGEGASADLGRYGLELALNHAQTDPDGWMMYHYALQFYKETKDYKSALTNLDKLVAALGVEVTKPGREGYQATIDNLKKQKVELESLAKGQ